MEAPLMASAIEISAALLAFGCAFFLMKAWSDHARRDAARRFPGGQNESRSWDGSLARLARNGVKCLIWPARRLCSVGPIGRFVGDLSRWLARSRGMECTNDSASTLLLAALIALGCACSLLAWNPVGGVAADALLVAVLVTRMRAWHEREVEAMRESVPTALNIMGECFSSGCSLVQTMGQVADQTDGRLSELFARCANVLKLGGTSREALECLRAERSAAELSFVAVALDVQHQAGGSIMGVLGSAQRMVEDEIELKRSMRVQTAQARLSARVVCLMPFVLVAVLSIMSEGFLSAFFESVQGLILLAVALAMEASGVLLVRRTLQVAE